MRTRFQIGLDELKEKLLRMGGMAERAIELAIEGYHRCDSAACQQVLDHEHAINTMEREIDEIALDLLAMQQPMASDLRFVLSVTKINADLERVGDQAVNIAERSLDLIALPAVDLPVDIPKIGAVATSMVRHSLEAFVSAKSDLAESVLSMDNLVDLMNRENTNVLLKVMKRSPENTRQALDALLISRNLERVADHATNIAEDVIFWVRGADVRHQGPDRPRTGKQL